MIIVVIILAILSVIIVAFLPNMTDQSRQSSTLSNLRSIASAMSLYRADHNRYTTATTILELQQELHPQYIANMVIHDGCGRSFYISSSNKDYTIVSGGKEWDGVSAISNVPVGATNTFESDIILTNGVFTQYPAKDNSS